MIRYSKNELTIQDWKLVLHLTTDTQFWNLLDVLAAKKENLTCILNYLLKKHSKWNSLNIKMIEKSSEKTKREQCKNLIKTLYKVIGTD